MGSLWAFRRVAEIERRVYQRWGLSVGGYDSRDASHRDQEAPMEVSRFEDEIPVPTPHTPIVDEDIHELSFADIVELRERETGACLTADLADCVDVRRMR